MLKHACSTKPLRSLLVDPETGEILVEAGTVMTRSAIEHESHLMATPEQDRLYSKRCSCSDRNPVVFKKFKVVGPNDPDRKLNSSSEMPIQSLCCNSADILAEMSYFSTWQKVSDVDIDHLGNHVSA